MQRQRTYLISNSKLSLEFGDITTSKADVLVSSDDANLSMGGGVSAAIVRAAGPQICIDTAKRTPAKVGDVILSSAGELSAKYIFHAVTLGAGAMSHDEVVRKITHRSLSLLPLIGLSSIAFPAIGSGAAGFTLETVASTMVDVIVNELRSSQISLDVTIYLFDRFGTMQEIDYIKFFEEVAVRTWALNNTVAVSPAPVNTTPGSQLNATPGVQRVLEPDAAKSHTVAVKKIFLASSSELKEDRREFEIFISRRNSSWVDKGIFLRVVAWEDFFDAMSRTRLQDEYNREIRNFAIYLLCFFGQKLALIRKRNSSRQLAHLITSEDHSCLPTSRLRL